MSLSPIQPPRQAHGEQRRDDEAEHRLNVLLRLNTELSDLDSTVGAPACITECVCDLTSASACALLLADGDTETRLHVHSAAPISEELIHAITETCLTHFTKASGQSLETSDITISTKTNTANIAQRAIALEYGHVEVLRSDKDVLGILLVVPRNQVSFNSETRNLIGLATVRCEHAIYRLKAHHTVGRSRLSLMVDSMADGLVMSDMNRDEVLINPAARRLLGIAPDELVTQLYLKERLGFYPFDLVAANAKSNELLREELVIGDKRLHSMVSPVRDTSQNVIGVVVVLRDFSDVHALAHRQEEFVAIVSHELRSPLTSISGALDIALSEYAGRLSDKQRRYLTLARSSCAELNQIVDDLLDVARSDQGGMPVHFTSVELTTLVKEVVDKYRSSAHAKRLNLSVRSTQTPLYLAGDPDRLTQVLNNLLSNAIKFTPVKGHVDVEVFGPSLVSSHVGVSVYNNGDSIADEDKERVFEKFEQVKDSRTRRVGGTGLGLAISRAIIEAHGGSIWVESGSAGAKFVFTLPAGSADVDVVPVAEVDSRLTPTPRGAQKILLVDTNSHTSYLVKGILMSAGYEVFVAADPDTALHLARARKPALILIHASDTFADPMALMEVLRHDPDTRKTPQLLLTKPSHNLSPLRSVALPSLPLPIDPGRLTKECARLLADSADRQGGRVLLADDDDAIRGICAEILTAAGMTVRQACDGASALRIAKEFRPDLLLLDVMMPDLDGFHTAQALQADHVTAMTPVIFLSAHGETADKVRAFEIGAEDYIEKPFVADELVARVQKALERRQREFTTSPTTQLPGSAVIQRQVEEHLNDRHAAFCYLDLDNLKAYNDYYGYAKADGMIRQTGDLIRDVVGREGNAADFVGHIAGDDFVFITTIDRVDAVCLGICRAFDRVVPLYYDKVDRDAGFIETKDRYDVLRTFPLMSVSIAVVTNSDTPFKSYSELASAAAAGKQRAKAVAGSSYVRNDKVIPLPWSV